MFDFKGHPRGLGTLFLTEAWERFSFYGLNAILVLYLVLPRAEGGLGYDTTAAVTLYGNYAMAVYLLSIVGGYVADRWTGHDGAVMIGGVIIIAGHATMAIGHDRLGLLLGLSCVALGTGLLKPNISVLVGQLYAPDDARRDAGYSLFYMGINAGAFFSPLVCGYLAQSQGFRRWLAGAGFDPLLSWHWGFGAAGIGMTIGVVFFAIARRNLVAAQASRKRPQPLKLSLTSLSHPGQRVIAISFFCLCGILFSSVLQQAAASLNLFADRYTDTRLFGYPFPSSWFQSVPAAFVVLLAPLLSALWLRLGKRQPSSVGKMLLGLGAATLAMALMILAAGEAVDGPVSPLWLLLVYAVITLGELCVNPVGLSAVTRVAPTAFVGIAMGLWFVATGLGSKLAGLFSAWLGLDQVDALSSAFADQALWLAIGTALLTLLALPAARALQTLSRAEQPAPVPAPDSPTVQAN